MLDKKISETIDLLIKKIKENNLGSIKFSNKTNCIEISNNSIVSSTNQTTQNILPVNNQKSQNDSSSNLLTIDSPMVGIVCLTPKPSSPPFAKKGQRIKKKDLISLRPVKGIPSENWKIVLGKKINKPTFESINKYI